MRPEICSTGALVKNLLKSEGSSVADIWCGKTQISRKATRRYHGQCLTKTIFKSGRVVAISDRKITSKMSICHCRSCTSSTTTCEIPCSAGSSIKRRSMTPVVQNKSRVDAERRVSPRMEYPTTCPTAASPNSSATRSATDTAATRRGCVQRTEVVSPMPWAKASSNR